MVTAWDGRFDCRARLGGVYKVYTQGTSYAANV